MDSAPLDAFAVAPRRRKPRLALIFLPFTLTLTIAAFVLYQFAIIALIAARRALRATFRPWFIGPYAFIWLVLLGTDNKNKFDIFYDDLLAMQALNDRTAHRFPPQQFIRWFDGRLALAPGHLPVFQRYLQNAIESLPLLIVIFAACLVVKILLTARDRGVRFIPRS